MTKTSLSTSVRRYFIDQFFFSKRNLINGKVIDIGGKKIKKRGLFDISEFSKDITYVNIEKNDKPDILADASSIPLPNESFDTAIMGELLEHVPDPLAVLKEAYRLLKPNGIVLATVPFMYPIHADPFDYGRYTESFWKRAKDLVGFKKIEIEKQGSMFAVLALMVQHFFQSKNISWRPIQFPLIKFLMWLDTKTHANLLLAWTTGYGFIMTK
ncbi:MAG TPA: class I SAM-dependent methyltransferase [Candidatus Paceibacterota bacterium]